MDYGRYKPRNISLELIAYQDNDPFGPELDKIHEEIRKIVMPVESIRQMDSLVTRGVFSEYVTKIEELVSKRLGLSISLNQDCSLGPCCMPYQIRLNHIANIRDKGWYTLSADSDPREFAISNYMSNGEIDLKHAKISGVLSKYNHFVNMEYWQVFKFARCSAREATAILLHELGHLFTFIDLGYRTDRTNQILNSISMSVKNSEPANKRKYLLVDLQELGMIEREDVERLAKEERHIIMSAKLYGAIYKKYVNTALSMEYTDHTGETVADDFAAKFGYAQDLATGLFKLVNKYRNASELRFKSDLYKTIILTLLSCILVPPVGIFLLVFNGALFFLNLLGNFFHEVFYRDSGMTYDDDRNRIERLKRFMIDRLKNKNISKGVRESTLIAIDTVEKAAAHWKDDQEYSTITKIIMFFSSDRCRVEEEIKIERQLENLASNKLFVASAKLQKHI